MKICIIGGGGAIGGYLAVLLANSGNEVTVMARGATLRAIEERGLALISDEHPEPIIAKVKAVENLRGLPKQDVIILAVKAHQVEPVIDDLVSVLSPETVLIPMQNGIPWWYFQKLNSKYKDHSVDTVDPGGVIMRILDDIRAEIWLKLWGNLTFNPISALTHGTLEGICRYPLTKELARNMMAEAQSIAEKLGVTFRVDIERRIAGAEKVGKHKTSMLQDLEAGRSLEIDALLGSVIELGEITETPTPCLNTVYALTKYLDQNVQDAKGSLILPVAAGY